MNDYNTSKKWPGYQREDVSCPECGYEYGHHKTLVDMNSEMCGPCAKRRGFKDIKLIDPATFISQIDWSI